MARRFLPVIAVLLLLAAFAAGLFTRIPVRTDMADFLPPGSTPATEFLFRELRSGSAATLILVGLEGAPEATLAAASRAMAEALRRSDAVSLVNNGAQAFGREEQEFLFKYRYLLSDVTRPAAFTAPALREKLEALLDGLNPRRLPFSAASASPTRSAPLSISGAPGPVRAACNCARASGSRRTASARSSSRDRAVPVSTSRRSNARSTRSPTPSPPRTRPSCGCS
jgi:hypothetical protein